MKKIKYLMPIIGLTGLASAAIPLTSCTTSSSRQIVIESDVATYSQSTNMDGDLVIILTPKDTNMMIKGVSQVKIGDTVLPSLEYGYVTNKVTIKQDILSKYSGNISITLDLIDRYTVNELTVKAPITIEYYAGEKLDLNGMVLTARCVDGVTRTIKSGYTTEPSVDTPLTVGVNKVIVSYGGKSTSFEIQVYAARLSSIQVTKTPNKTRYIAGKYLDLNGMVVTGVYSDGTTAPVTDYETTPSIYTALTEEDTEVTVTYKGKTDKFAIQVDPTIDTDSVALSTTAPTTLVWTSSGVDGTSLEYKIGDGEWTTATTGGKINFGTGSSDKVLKLRGSLKNAEDQYNTFSIKKTGSESPSVTLSGSLMNLLLTDGEPATELPDYAFANLFANNGLLENIVENEEVSLLPAKTATYYCYYNMFYNCSSLKNAPQLPATTLAEGCYREMFNLCTSLTKPCDLPATNLAKLCYYRMFGYNAFVKPPKVDATSLAVNCFGGMFLHCANLTEMIDLSKFTTLADQCYQDMFMECTALTTPKDLPAKTLTKSCYYRMFYGSGLTTPPIIGAESLVQSSCCQMFYKSNIKVNNTSGTAFFTCPDTTPSSSVSSMFYQTKGTYTADPVTGETYYFTTE